MNETFSARDYMRDMRLPFCPGCGLFSLSYTFLKAMHDLGHKDLSGFCFPSGIGCTAWVPSPFYLADSIHTLHGRSIPVATGIALSRPDLKVVVFGGDGDIVGIGLSHFIHAARRNTDLLVIMGNNMVYGQTGGHVAPTTPAGTRTATSPYGSIETPLDVATLAATVGAAYSARWTTAHPAELGASFRKAIPMKGFRFVEVVFQCPTAYGRRAGYKNVGDLLKHFKESAVSVQEAKGKTQEEIEAATVVGEFVEKRRPTLVEGVYAMMEGRKANVRQN